MRILFVGFFLTLALNLALAACATPSFDVQPRYGRPEISGTAGATSGGVGGSADLEQAGLEDDEALSARVDLDFGSAHLIGLADAPQFEGSGTLDVSVSDGTNTIAGGAPVDSKLDLAHYDLALVFDLIPGDTFELGLGFGAAYFDLDFRFEESGTGTIVASEEQVPVPFLALTGAVWLGPVELAAFAGGMEYTYDNDTLSFLDLDAYARCKLFGGHRLLRTSLVVGYRLTQFELDYDDANTQIDTDFTIQGPYVGLEVMLERGRGERWGLGRRLLQRQVRAEDALECAALARVPRIGGGQALYGPVDRGQALFHVLEAGDVGQRRA